MRSTSISFVVAVLMTSQPEPPRQTDWPVVSSNPNVVTFMGNPNVVEFTVTNNGPQAVTAWEVAVEAIFSDDSVRNLSLMREGYMDYEGLSPNSDAAIPSRGSVLGRVPIRARNGETIVAVRTAVRWAVFADGSGMAIRLVVKMCSSPVSVSTKPGLRGSQRSELHRMLLLASKV